MVLVGIGKGHKGFTIHSWHDLIICTGQMTPQRMSRQYLIRCVYLSELFECLSLYSCKLPWSWRLSLKVFSDASGAMWKKSVKDIDGDILCVSQFTLLANTAKGNKPDFHRAMVRLLENFLAVQLKIYPCITVWMHHKSTIIREQNQVDNCMPLFWRECPLSTSQRK